MEKKKYFSFLEGAEGLAQVLVGETIVEWDMRPLLPPIAVTSEPACKSLLKYLLLAAINN